MPAEGMLKKFGLNMREERRPEMTICLHSFLQELMDSILLHIPDNLS
jgi:hypothetical protein